MQNNAIVGGILSIVAGGIGCLGAAMIILFAVFFGVMSTGYYYDDPFSEGFFGVFVAIYAVMGVAMLLIAVLAIIGGVYGIKKRYWGLALAGAIAAAVAFFPAGVVAIVFTALGKKEFAVGTGQAPAVVSA